MNTKRIALFGFLGLIGFLIPWLFLSHPELFTKASGTTTATSAQQLQDDVTAMTQQVQQLEQSIQLLKAQTTETRTSLTTAFALTQCVTTPRCVLSQEAVKWVKEAHKLDLAPQDGTLDLAQAAHKIIEGSAPKADKKNSFAGGLLKISKPAKGDTPVMTLAHAIFQSPSQHPGADVITAAQDSLATIKDAEIKKTHEAFVQSVGTWYAQRDLMLQALHKIQDSWQTDGSGASPVTEDAAVITPPPPTEPTTAPSAGETHAETTSPAPELSSMPAPKEG